MKIGSTTTTPTSVAEERQGTAVRGRETAATRSSRSAGDAVSLSSAATSMGAMDSASGDFDTAKVDAIRQAIREGRFSVNAEAIADRLIAEATALLGPRGH